MNEMIRNDLDLASGLIQERTRFCRRCGDDLTGRRYVVRTCTPWDKAFSCKPCYRIEVFERDEDLRSRGFLWPCVFCLEETGRDPDRTDPICFRCGRVVCPRCGEEKTSHRHLGEEIPVCFKCQATDEGRYRDGHWYALNGKMIS